MCGSSEIFLMPPISFGVRTCVVRSDPLWSPTGVKQDPFSALHHFRRVLMLRFSKTWPAPALNRTALYSKARSCRRCGILTCGGRCCSADERVLGPGPRGWVCASGLVPAAHAAVGLGLLPFKLLYRNLRRWHGSAWVTRRPEPLPQQRGEGVRGEGVTLACLGVAPLPPVRPCYEFPVTRDGCQCCSGWGAVGEFTLWRWFFSCERFESYRC